MCIVEQVASYKFAGKLYDKEIDAVEAALDEIASRIRAETTAAPIRSLLRNREALIELLGRHAALSPTPAPMEVASEKGPTTLLVGVFKGHQPDCDFVTCGDDCTCGMEE